MTAAMMAYVLHYLKINMVEASYAMLETVGASMALYILIAGYLLRKDVQKIFANFQDFHDSSKYFAFWRIV